MVKKADAYVLEFLDVYKGKLLNKKRVGSLSIKEAFVDSVTTICTRLIMEVKEIMKMRKATSDLAFTAVIKEQNQKWRAIARRLGDKKLPFNAHPDSFQIVWDQFKTQMMK